MGGWGVGGGGVGVEILTETNGVKKNWACHYGTQLAAVRP